jgi:hypothetical protein
MYDRTRLLELKAAIADRSVVEAAGERRLLRYNRTTTAAAGYDIRSAVRDELHRHITPKIITFAVATVIIASMTAGMIALLLRAFAT